VATASARVRAGREAFAKALRRHELAGAFRSARSRAPLLFPWLERRPPRWASSLGRAGALPLLAGGLAAVMVAGLVVSQLVRPRPAPSLAAPTSAPATERDRGRGGAPAWAPAAGGRPGPAAALPGLIGQWRFDEAPGLTAVIDQSDSRNDCVMRGLDAGARVAGHSGGALHFGLRGWLECPRSEAFARLDAELTMAAWIRPVSLWGAQTIAGRQKGRGRVHDFFFGLVNGQLNVTSRTWRKRLDVPLPPAPGPWRHVAFTRSADGAVALYADGVLLRRIKGRRQPIGGTTSPLTIGGGITGPDPTHADELFAGDLDEVVAFARALSDAEIAALAR
jgi:concanavalin A-like lectin/glucanase superfamily protein